MDNITLYNAARQDLYLNDIPGRNEAGYLPNRTQRSILNQQKYNAITTRSLKIQQFSENIGDIRQEILAYKLPVDNAIAQGKLQKDSYNSAIEEVRDNINMLEQDLKKFDEDMLNRGMVPAVQIQNSDAKKTAEQRQIRKGINWKAIGAFVLIWGTGEVFMTYVQYNSLRYDKSIESIVARSIAFAVVLFLIHLVAHWNKQQRRIIYIVFLAFSFLMVFCMLFLPLILNQLFPEATVPAVADQWSLNSYTNTAAVSQVSSNPLWVELYRKNDMIPGVLSFLFFLIMTGFIKKEHKPAVETPRPGPEELVNPITDEIVKKREYFLNKIKQEKSKLSALEDEQKLINHPSTETLHQILQILNEKKQKKQAFEEEKEQLIAARQILLNEVKNELAKYEVEFREALNNDALKNTIIKPEWPSENDIVNYYKIRKQ